MTSEALKQKSKTIFQPWIILKFVLCFTYPREKLCHLFSLAQEISSKLAVKGPLDYCQPTSATYSSFTLILLDLIFFKFVISGKHFFMWVGYFLRHSHFLSGRILSHKVIWRLLVHSLINCKFMVTLCLQVLNCWWHESIVQLFLNFNSELQIIGMAGMAKGFLVYVDTAALRVCFYTFLKTSSWNICVFWNAHCFCFHDFLQFDWFTRCFVIAMEVLIFAAVCFGIRRHSKEIQPELPGSWTGIYF